MAADKLVTAITRTVGETGARNGDLFFQLKVYDKRTAQWKAYDNFTDFQLPDGFVMSPDASLLRLAIDGRP